MSEQALIKLAIWVGVWVGSLVVLFGLFFSIRYKLSATHLRITVLGIPVRWFRIRDIRQMTTEPKFWAERWYNTLTPEGRHLAIRRKHGLIWKTVILTPENPFVLMHELEKAKAKLKAAEGPKAVAATLSKAKA